ncbi:hypothetical protein RFI_23182 [Reticulomyxa filosa]|uniref:Uncharacterized protein n=1 Tax=Reticulomyxa filosa TaxID=46433 RepID=X6MKL2_RETFI|nr:hypothetical protein RFI_23182 [Reticulomyxa filosa]|eukprot:ETO14186.1 hypothetical protein RFI_23182 [Reticulomyxa filosa]
MFNPNAMRRALNFDGTNIVKTCNKILLLEGKKFNILSVGILILCYKWKNLSFAVETELRKPRRRGGGKSKLFFHENEMMPESSKILQKADINSKSPYKKKSIDFFFRGEHCFKNKNKKKKKKILFKQKSTKLNTNTNTDLNTTSTSDIGNENSVDGLSAITAETREIKNSQETNAQEVDKIQEEDAMNKAAITKECEADLSSLSLDTNESKATDDNEKQTRSRYGRKIKKVNYKLDDYFSWEKECPQNDKSAKMDTGIFFDFFFFFLQKVRNTPNKYFGSNKKTPKKKKVETMNKGDPKKKQGLYKGI